MERILSYTDFTFSTDLSPSLRMNLMWPFTVHFLHMFILQQLLSFLQAEGVRSSPMKTY
jgi:hypothetical protein